MLLPGSILSTDATQVSRVQYRVQGLRDRTEYDEKAEAITAVLWSADLRTVISSLLWNSGQLSKTKILFIFMTQNKSNLSLHFIGLSGLFRSFTWYLPV